MSLLNLIIQNCSLIGDLFRNFFYFIPWLTFSFSWICEGLILRSTLIAAPTRSVGRLLTNFVLHVYVPKWKICAFSLICKQYTSWRDRLRPVQVHLTVHKSLKSWISVCFFLQTLKWTGNLGLSSAMTDYSPWIWRCHIHSSSFLNLFSMVVHLDIFLVCLYDWILLWNILSFRQYQTVSRLLSGVWYFSQVLSSQTLCPCKSTNIVTSSSLSLLLQLESPTKMRKYVWLCKWTDSEDTGIIRIGTLCSYLILILLEGTYWRCALKISEWIIPTLVLRTFVFTNFASFARTREHKYSQNF